MSKIFSILHWKALRNKFGIFVYFLNEKCGYKLSQKFKKKLHFPTYRNALKPKRVGQFWGTLNAYIMSTFSLFTARNHLKNFRQFNFEKLRPLLTGELDRTKKKGWFENLNFGFWIWGKNVLGIPREGVPTPYHVSCFILSIGAGYDGIIKWLNAYVASIRMSVTYFSMTKKILSLV